MEGKEEATQPKALVAAGSLATGVLNLTRSVSERLDVIHGR